MGTFSPSFDTGNISVEDGNILIKGDDGKDYVMPLKGPLCYEASIGASFDFTGPPVTEQSADPTIGTGAVAPITAPIRITNTLASPILITEFRIRYGANGYTGSGSQPLGGVSFAADPVTDVSGVNGTIRFSNAAGLELSPGQAITNTQASTNVTTGPFQGPTPINLAAASGIFRAGNQPRMDVTYIIGTPAIETIRGHEYSDGETSLFVYFDASGDPVTIDLANIPTGWTQVPCEDDAPVLAAQYRTGVTIAAADVSPVNSVLNVDTGPNLTVPAGVFLAANAGASITIRNSTGGNLTITADAGVTLEGDGDLIIANGEAAELVATDADNVVWVIC